MEKAWWKEGVVYQVYPRSFCDSNGDGIGDIRGITSKLGYLRELGIDVIWLSPVYASPNYDNGYDISDYRAIMPEFGTMEDFDDLLAQAHSLGIKILMDLVANHTSMLHPWFVQSRSSADNPYRNYYIWADEPNDWEAVFGGSAWEYDKRTGQYYLHLFTKEQPDLNWENPEVRREIYEMMRWWLAKGIDGFRLDAINMISKPPGFPSGKPVAGTPYTEIWEVAMHGPNIHTYMQEMHREVFAGRDIMTVGEMSKTTPEVAVLYCDPARGELNMVFHFEHVLKTDYENELKWCDPCFSLLKFKRILSEWQTALHGRGWNSLYLNNHDQPRSVSRFGNDGTHREKSAKMLATCLHMMQGTPYIYQGEELGMTNIAFETPEEYNDVETRNAYREYTVNRGVSHADMMRYIHKNSRDNARTPMQWSADTHAGFTTGTPWLGVNPNYTQINAAAQVGDPGSVFNHYKELVRLRKTHPVIVYGDYRLLPEHDPNVFAYIRRYEGESLLVLCNFGAEQQHLDILDVQEWQGAELLITNCADGGSLNELTPYAAHVYLLRG